jgi:hypothetical protein
MRAALLSDLASELRPFGAACWRLVESQHRISTLKLVETLEEQAMLEDILEDTKPTIPPECRHLDYLLSTPFRYDAPYPHGSRFRRAGMTSGVYYAALSPDTALAEMVFYRLLFFAEAPDVPFPDNAAEYSAFSVRVETGRALDLTNPPMQSERWENPQDYGPCQDLADTARAAGAEIIRYQSVRDPLKGTNLAVLRCETFRTPTPEDRQTWRIRLSENGAQAVCDFPRRAIEFTRADFTGDSRIG